MLKILNNEKEPKNLKYLKKTTNIIDKLKDKSSNTKKSYFACLVSMLKLDGGKEYEKALKVYKTNMDDLNRKSNKAQEQNRLSEKQKENWITSNEMDKKYSDLEKKVKKLKPIDFEERKYYKDLLDFTILSLYLLIFPRRSKDYTQMNLILTNDQDKIKNLSNKLNYYDPFKNEFIFNEYKTSKKFGQQIIKVPLKLKNILSNLTKYNSLLKDAKDDSIPMFLQSNGRRITPDYITKSLNRIFDKKISTSMIRHIVISEKFGKLLKEQQKVADAMAHSLGMQKAYIKYPDNKVNHDKVIEV